MDRIEKRKIYREYLETLNESKSREDKINHIIKKKINKFLVNDVIIDDMVARVVNRDSTKGLQYLVWFCDRMKKYFLDHIEKENVEVYPKMKSYLETGKVDDKELESELEEIVDMWFNPNPWDVEESDNFISVIVDWLKSPLREDKVDLNQFKTLDDASDVAQAWHDNLKATGIVHNEQGKVLMTFDDGYYWIDLETTSDKAEGEAMGHCGDTTNGTTLYSLRKNQSPHVTMAINENDKLITQCKGRNNKKPIKKYHKYIVDLMMSDNFPADSFKLEYDTGDDFSINDLDKELYKKIIDFNPKFIYFHDNVSIGKFLNSFEGYSDIYEKLDSVAVYNIIVFLLDDKHVNKETGERMWSWTSIDDTNDDVDDEIIKIEIDTDVIKQIIDNVVVFKEWDNGGEVYATLTKIGDKIILKKDRADFLNITFIKDNHQGSSFENNTTRNKIIELVPKINFSDPKDTYLHSAKTQNNFSDLLIQDTINFILSKNTNQAAKKAAELSKQYDEEIHIPKLKEEQKNLYDYMNEYLGFKIIKLDSVNIEIEIDSFEFFKKVQKGISLNWNKRIQDTEEIVRYWRDEILDLTKKKRYNFEYDILDDLNKYIIDNFTINEPVNEVYGMSDNTTEWIDFFYDLIAYKSIPQFLKSIDEMNLVDEIEIFDETIETESASLLYNANEMNELIKKGISKDNKLKLKDIDFEINLTICPVEYFDTELFSGYYDDSKSEYKDGVVYNGKMFFDIYIPEDIFDIEINKKNIDNFLKENDIKRRLYSMLTHETDHINELTIRASKGVSIFPEKVLNHLVNIMKNHKFSEISNEWHDFLQDVYLHLSFEQNARIPQLYTMLKDKNITNQSEFWKEVKQTTVWLDLQDLKDFDAKEFMDEFTLNMKDEDIKDVFRDKKVFPENEIDNTEAKILVMRYLLGLWDDYIDEVNKSEIKLDKLPPDVFKDPYKFFKFFEERFHKNYKKIYRKIAKLSVDLIK